ncbi:MAG: hypothetical protein HY290_04540 [Planctomycetia bacterium]|nr:hypothetical protein [Planctomycetia bacterium]
MKPSTEQGVRRPLSERLAATFIYTALNPIFGDTISPADAAAYCDDATRECEFSGDRIELWLLEQASALQAVSLALHGKTTAIADPVQLTAVSGAASRLTAELRRTIAALMAYRASRRRRLRSAPAETTSTKAAQAHAKRGAGSAETGTPASSPETVKGARRKAR